MTRYFLQWPGRFLAVAAIAFGAMFATGCDDKMPVTPETEAATVSAAHKHESAGETCFICDPGKREPGRLWCKEHGRYEDRCWLCHPELEEKDRLYCKEHSLYEDECHLCHPELKQDAPTKDDAKASSSDAAPAELCKAHKADTNLCFICDPSLREKGRLWCKEHDRYEDRCWLCHAELQDKSRAYCEEHHLYEDECFLCDPSRRPKTSAPAGDRAADRKTASAGLFCNEHQVPEIECGICQPDLAGTLQPGQSLKIRFASAQSTAKAGVRTGSPTPAQSAPTVTAYCEVRYNQNATAQITPLVPGVVRRVLTDVGAQVKAGDVLVELESPELARAKADYLMKLQAVSLAKIDLDRSTMMHDNIKTALSVLSRGSSLGELESLSNLDLGQNRRDLLSTHARYVAAAAAYDREQKLQAQKISSEAELQRAEADYRSALAEHLGVKDELAFASKRDLEVRTRAHESAQFELESARRQLFTLGLSESQIEQVPTQKSAELSRQEIRAPIDGTIIERKASVGEAVEVGEGLLTMANLSNMWLALSIPSDQAALIKEGMYVEATLPHLEGGVAEGKLVWVDTAIDESSRMVAARAVLDNVAGKLKAGMFGEARITVGKPVDAVRVPKSAVQQYEKNPYVFVKLEDDLYALRRVALGGKSETAVDVIRGLDRQEPVVVAGAFTVMSEFLKSRLGAGCVDD